MNEGKIFIRSATGQDREKLRAMFARSSPQTIYRRFHSPYPEVPEWMVALILGADQHDREILGAVAEEKVVGHAMYARIGSGPAAEMAIVVEDGWQSKGIGKRLLSELAARARRRGIEAFTAEVLATNSAISHRDRLHRRSTSRQTTSPAMLSSPGDAIRSPRNSVTPLRNVT